MNKSKNFKKKIIITNVIRYIKIVTNTNTNGKKSQKPFQPGRESCIASVVTLPSDLLEGGTFEISLARYLRGSACFANSSKDLIVYSICTFLYELHQVFKARQHPSLAYPLHFISPSRLMHSKQLTGHFSQV